MFKPPFSLALKNERRRLGLTQSQASKETGISAKRWSNLETGHRFPTPSEEWVIQKLLGRLHYQSWPVDGRRVLRANVFENLAFRQPYWPAQERPSYFRFRSAEKHYPGLVHQLMSKVRTRQDFELCAYFCEKVACGSRLESLYLLYLLSQGAKPTLVAPASLGFLPHAVVAPDSRVYVGNREHPCLVCQGCWFFFQVAFLTPDCIIVDVLLWNKGWKIIEIDGAGHDATGDAIRDLTLRIPVRRITGHQLVRDITESQTA